jgi:hypothetical protein
MTRPTTAALGFASFDAIAALLVCWAAYGGLPTRWWVVDVGAFLVAASLGLGAAGVLSSARWGTIAARISAGVVLGIGLMTITLLSVSVGTMRGFYGPIGKGGALVFVLVVALLVPYLVVLPSAQLLWLHARERKR